MGGGLTPLTGGFGGPLRENFILGDALWCNLGHSNSLLDLILKLGNQQFFACHTTWLAYYHSIFSCEKREDLVDHDHI